MFCSCCSSEVEWREVECEAIVLNFSRMQAGPYLNGRAEQIYRRPAPFQSVEPSSCRIDIVQ
jgi:hypothetical protein